MRKLSVFFIFVISVLLVVGLTAGPALADDRHFIGDQPASALTTNTADGAQLNQGIQNKVDQENSMLPYLLPDSTTTPFVWARYPLASYYFQTAEADDTDFYNGKMQDAASAISDQIANVTFYLPKYAARLGCQVIAIAFSNDFTKDMRDFVTDGIHTLGANITQSIAGFIFLIALCVLGLGAAFYVFRGQVVKAFASIFIAIFFLVGFYIYIDTAGTWIPTLMDWIDNTTGFTLTATSFMKLAPVAPESKYTGTIGQEETPSVKQGIAESTNTMWQVLIGGPWAVGEFGESDPNKLKLSGAQINQIEKGIPAAATRQIASDVAWGTFEAPTNPVGAANNVIDAGTTAWQLLIGGLKQDFPDTIYADTYWLGSSPAYKTDLIKIITSSAGKVSAITASGQSGESGMHHLFIAFLSVAPALIFAVFAFAVGIPVFFAQVMIMVMLLLAPLALLLGMAGEGGLAFALKFLRTGLGYLGIKIIYGFYLGMIMLLAVSITQVSKSTQSPGTASFLISVIFFIAVKYHKDFFNGVMSVVTFSPGAEHSHISEKLREDYATAKGVVEGVVGSRIVSAVGKKIGNRQSVPPAARHTSQTQQSQGQQGQKQDQGGPGQWRPRPGVSAPPNPNPSSSESGAGAATTRTRQQSYRGGENKQTAGYIQKVETVSSSPRSDQSNQKQAQVTKQTGTATSQKQAEGPTAKCTVTTSSRTITATRSRSQAMRRNAGQQQTRVYESKPTINTLKQVKSRPNTRRDSDVSSIFLDQQQRALMKSRPSGFGFEGQHTVIPIKQLPPQSAPPPQVIHK